MVRESVSVNFLFLFLLFHRILPVVWKVFLLEIVLFLVADAQQVFLFLLFKALTGERPACFIIAVGSSPEARIVGSCFPFKGMFVIHFLKPMMFSKGLLCIDLQWLESKVAKQ